MNKDLIINNENIKDRINIIRGKQVILDRDISELYGVETKRLNEQVKRNIKRFPEDFMFQLNFIEKEELVAKCDRLKLLKHSSQNPFVFTEQGIAMLSSVLKSNKAIEVNIKIMRAFISMRKFLIQNKNILNKFQQIDEKLIEHDKNFEKVFDYMSLNEPKQGIFFDGEVFDAYLFISNLIKKAKDKIILIDNYIDEEILQIFTKTSVKVKILTKNVLNLDVKKLNLQYKNIEIKYFDKSHDRFLVIDNEIYHLGASLKDLGKKWFAFSLIKDKDLLNKLQNNIR